MAGMATDPWGDESEQPTTLEATATVIEVPATATDDDTPMSCPHCGTPLTPHHDAVGSLHCNDPRCANCCFLPPDETQTEPQLKPELILRGTCKMARVAASF